MAGGEADLSGFLEAAGRSLEEAQRELGSEEGTEGIAPTMAISEVELEAKVTLEDAGEKVMLRPVSSEAAQTGGIHPDLVSTVRVRYVAVPGEAGVSDEADAEP